MNIYVHIPFCRSKCAYCGFLSHCNVACENEYIGALISEISLKIVKTKDRKVTTIYFGGGTPSYIKPELIKSVIEKLNHLFELDNSIEITLETNPEDITESNLKSWKKAGVNRISIGVQSFDNNVRKTVKRSSSITKVFEKIKLAQKYFDNIGVDLISGLPGESPMEFAKGIERVSKLGIKHISVYDLEISSNSNFSQNPGNYSLKSEDEKADFLQRVWDQLADLGFRQYEISNFCRGENFCKHNLDFWLGRDYLGFGLGAVSRIEGSIIKNTEEFDKYLSKKFIKSAEKISQDEQIKLSLILVLRLDLKLEEFFERYERAMNLDFGSKIEKLTDSGFYDKDNDTLTKKGKLLHNSVVDFLINN